MRVRIMPGRSQSFYYMYQGERVVASGTAQQLANSLNVTIEAVYKYATPKYKQKYGGSDKNYIAVKVGTTAEEDLKWVSQIQMTMM